MTIYHQFIARVEELAKAIGDSLQLRGFKTGGTVGQVPRKVDGTDFNWEWADVSATNGVPAGGTAGQVLTKNTGDDFDLVWADPASGVTSYNDLTDVPTTFPNDDVTAATAAATPSTVVKRDVAGAASFTELSIVNGTISAGTLTLGVQDGITGAINLVNDIDGSTARIVNSNQSGAYIAPPTVSGTIAKTANTDGTPDALHNSTISGTVAFGSGAAANMLTALGGGTAGKAVFAAETAAAAATAAGVGAANNVTFASALAQLNIPLVSGSGFLTWKDSGGVARGDIYMQSSSEIVFALRNSSGSYIGFPFKVSIASVFVIPATASTSPTTGSLLVSGGAGIAGALHVGGPVGLKSYTVASVPAANVAAGQTIYVSNESGGAVLAFSDGTNWLRVTDRAIIS